MEKHKKTTQTGNLSIYLQSLRARIAAAGYQTTIYTGTFGVTQLRNINNEFVNIYLHTNNQLPVPMYFYKVTNLLITHHTIIMRIPVFKIK